MNGDTLARICKLKTSDGAFAWQPGMVEGQAAALLGYPVIENEDCPLSASFAPASYRRPRRDADPAQSIQQQAFLAFLCNQKGGRCDHRFERHQAVEVRRQLKRLVREGARSRLPSLSGRAGRLPAGIPLRN